MNLSVETKASYVCTDCRCVTPCRPARHYSSCPRRPQREGQTPLPDDEFLVNASIWCDYGDGFLAQRDLGMSILWRDSYKVQVVP